MKKEASSNILPLGWSRAIIDEIIDINGIFKDGDWIESKDQNPHGAVRLIQLADLGDGVFKNRSSRFMTYEQAVNLGCTFLEEGDVLVARMPEPLGRAVVFPLKEKNKYVTVVDIAIIRPKNKYISNLYLKYCFNSPYIRKEIHSLQTGTTRKRISRGNLSNILLPIPPYNEQIKIVGLVEELFSGLDNCLQDLNLALDKLKAYEQSLLKFTFEGKLSRQWREAVKPEVAASILKRIRGDRRIVEDNLHQEWKSAMKIWMIDKEGKKPEKPRKIKSLNPFDDDVILEFPLLPDEWSWSKVDLLAKYEHHSIKAGPFGSSLKKDSYTRNGQYKVYGQEQVIAGNHGIGDYFIPEKKYNELRSCKVGPADILISLVGTVGKVLVLPENCQEGIINPRLIKISLDLRYYNPKFFKFYFESLFLKSLYSNQTHGATMDVLNLGIIENLPFPFLTLEEQELIVNELDSQFSGIKYLETTIYNSIKKIEVLKNKILENAITGKLSAQSSQDESSINFLNRIKAHKEKLHGSIIKRPRPVKINTMNTEPKKLLDILKSNSDAILARDLWQMSSHQENIEEFYAELKKIEDQIIEVKNGTESLISLKR